MKYQIADYQKERGSVRVMTRWRPGEKLVSVEVLIRRVAYQTISGKKRLWFQRKHPGAMRIFGETLWAEAK